MYVRSSARARAPGAQDGAQGRGCTSSATPSGWKANVPQAPLTRIVSGRPTGPRGPCVSQRVPARAGAAMKSRTRRTTQRSISTSTNVRRLAVHYAGDVATRAESRRDEREWFLRALLVLHSPRSVFASLRDDSDEAAEARADTAGAIVWLAGIAAVLATTVASTLLDDVQIHGALLTVWAFLAGGLYGFTLYFVVGKVLHVALRKLGGRGSFRRARHVLAFAAVPIALALFVYWPIRIVVYGWDLFRTGGARHACGDGRGGAPRGAPARRV